MSDQPTQPQAIGQIRTPERWTAGVYANGVGVWHSQNEFTIDFLVNLPGEVTQDPEGNMRQVIPNEVVARVKIPPSLTQQLIGNLTTELEKYRQRYGTPPQFGTGIFGIEDADDQ